MNAKHGSESMNQSFASSFTDNEKKPILQALAPLKVLSTSLSLTFIISLCLFSIGCQKKRPQVQVWQPPQYDKTENPAELSESKLMSKVTDIAVLPFLDNTKEQEHTLNYLDLKTFAEQFSSHLVGSETFTNIMYPAPALERLKGEALSLNRQDDLKEIGNLLDVDAIVFGVIQSYNMYHPARMSISMKFYLTRAERFATANEVSALAHSGMPLHHYNPTFFKQLWNTSAYYDSGSNHFKERLGLYLKSHEASNFGFGDQRFVRTKRDFIEVIAFDLAASLNLKSNEEEKSYNVAPHKGKRRLRSPRPYFND